MVIKSSNELLSEMFDYFEISVSLDDYLIMGEKFGVDINDCEIYHELAANFKIKTLHTTSDSRLTYLVRSACLDGDWSISLRRDKVSEFKEKYGNNYQIYPTCENLLIKESTY